MTSGTRLTLVSVESTGLIQAEDNQVIVIYFRPASGPGNCSIGFIDELGQRVLRSYTIELSYTFPTKEWRQPDLVPNETSELNSSSPWTA
jgi:hypothetical protein